MTVWHCSWGEQLDEEKDKEDENMYMTRVGSDETGKSEAVMGWEVRRWSGRAQRMRRGVR